MGNFFSRDEETGYDKTISINEKNILYLPKECRLYNNARLTPEFKKKCRDKLRENIKYELKRNLNLYIHFPCMLPSLSRTFNSKNNREITNRFNSNKDMCIAYIENPLDYNQYLPILPVFELIQEILKEMELHYTVTFDRINYKNVIMMEENAVLLINIIQKEPQYMLRIKEHDFENDNENSLYTKI